MSDLTNEQIAELEALDQAERAIGHPTSIYKSHWHNTTGDLARMRLVTWKRGGAAWGPSFREVGLTERGLRTLYAIPEAERKRILEAEMATYDDAETYP